MELFGFMFFWVMLVSMLAFVPIVMLIVALVDVVRAPDAAFGPPWENTKNAWTLGLALGYVVPAGAIVGSVLWWVQVRPALRSGRQVPRPFWAPRPAYPYQPPGPPAPPAG